MPALRTSTFLTSQSKMFRLPTHLESFIPPPRDQVPTSRPWTGSLRLPSSSSVFCTAAETEGEK